jgi:glyoxylase-like metal-dependent hydrolase (beta-lactamase superfamily II)
MNECISVFEYEGGVLAIDSGFVRERMAACYLVEAGDELAFIEVGTNSSTPRLLQVLEQRGWSRSDVRYVIVTHVHLDHAGGAGSLMQALPEATFIVHPRGGRHMVDPSRLEASARGVYGDAEFDRMYGSLVPIEQSRVREMNDGDSLVLGDRTLEFIDTPGHARHHFCVWDSKTQGWFSGDTFGLSYPELDTEAGPFVFPTTTPIQFDPPALRESINRLMQRSPRWMYLTHFGRVGDTARLAQDMLAAVDRFAEMGERHEGSANRGQALRDEIVHWLMDAVKTHGVTLPRTTLEDLLQMDIELNASGIEFWLQGRHR